MYLIRDIFQLKFGLFKETMQHLKVGVEHKLFPSHSIRVLSDFTGDSYRLIFEI
ncbi:MAG: hypothetical protein M3Q56_07910 [Bacteroidota bacterium]|nr:hypothetical protein [Bacteroidota bacterium]